MTHWLTLSERARGAKGEDREMDADLATAVGAPPDNLRRAAEPCGGLWISLIGTNWCTWVAPRYTASLDAIVSLIEQQLPGRGHGYASGWQGKGTFGGFIGQDEHRVDLAASTIAIAATPALALVAAFCLAMHEKEKGG